MNANHLFEGRDLALMESLKYDPSLRPSFDNLRDCLVWADERPEGLTPRGYESLIDLFIARSFVHRKRDFATHKLDPDYFRDVWHRAIEQGLGWPGFNRLTLSSDDEVYYQQMLSEPQEV